MVHQLKSILSLPSALFILIFSNIHPYTRVSVVPTLMMRNLMKGEPRLKNLRLIEVGPNDAKQVLGEETVQENLALDLLNTYFYQEVEYDLPGCEPVQHEFIYAWCLRYLPSYCISVCHYLALCWQVVELGVFKVRAGLRIDCTTFGIVPTPRL